MSKNKDSVDIADVISYPTQEESKKQNQKMERGKIRSLTWRTWKKKINLNHQVHDLGCTSQKFQEHILDLLEKAQKTDPLMTPENYAKHWSFDHIVPLSSFDLTDPEQCKMAANYKNVRPIQIEENCRKFNNRLEHIKKIILVGDISTDVNSFCNFHKLTKIKFAEMSGVGRSTLFAILKDPNRIPMDSTRNKIYDFIKKNMKKKIS